MSEARFVLPLLTERSRRVLAFAQEEARRLNHNYIGTEHLLLGLVRENEGVAAGVLQSMGVDTEKTRVAVEFIIGRGQPRTETRHYVAKDAEVTLIYRGVEYVPKDTKR